ncbi:unnamed protein product [Paramecium sonneborni]|uniref:Uncharacterized protein n=1 Tax=Paramecium sonneborni TaxID=65129 RepID=A0A8S1M4D7_9CILI|nr:unnamed protein product [Paramecium sonneborni]
MRQRPLFLNVDLSFQPNKTINKSPVQRTKTSLKETQKSQTRFHSPIDTQLTRQISTNINVYTQYNFLAIETSVEQQADLQPQQMLNKKFQLNKLLISK